MERTPVNSTNLSYVWYDEASNTLGIEFTSGSQYEYYEVPLNVLEGLMGPGSKGQYFNENIRGKFRYARV
jgi:hypothetical protein